MDILTIENKFFTKVSSSFSQVLELFADKTPKHSEFLTGSVLGVCIVPVIFAVIVCPLALYHWSLLFRFTVHLSSSDHSKADADLCRNLTTLENTEKMIKLGVHCSFISLLYSRC